MTPSTAPTRSRRRTRALAVGGVVALAAAAAATPAQADSIVFVKDANVWLANPDGSGQHQVTTDGTADNPWQSPSQADDGTIVAVRAQPNNGPIVHMRQNGTVLNAIRLPGMQYGPYEPAISPDGRHVAYESAFMDTMGSDTDVHYANSEGVTAPGTYPLAGRGTGSPSWTGDGRVLVGTYTQVLTQAPGQTAVPWWNDWDLQPRYFPASEDLDDGELAANGTLAFVRGDRDGNTIQLYRSNGAAALPTPTCVLSGPSAGPLGQRFSDPTFAPGGGALAWQEGDGIWTTTLTPGSCEASAPRLLIPGASEPDWGPAPVNPGPRETPPPAPAPAPVPVPRPAPPVATPRVAGPAAPAPATRRSTTGRATTGRPKPSTALARCAALPRGRRAACLKRARRAAALEACRRTTRPGRARARCVAKARRRFA